MQRLIARALLVAVAIAAWKVGIHDEWTGLQSVADFFRTWVLLSNAVALVLLIVEANWPSIRNTFELEGLSERLASVVTVTLGISMSMMVLSFLQGLLEGTTAAHDGLVTGAHHGMSPIGHTVREGASIAPIALIVVALGPLAARWIRNVRTKGVRVNPLSAVRWGLVVALLAGVTVAVTGAAPADAAVPSLAGCSADTAVRAYDVAAVNAFIPYSRWINDSGVAQNGPDGFPHRGDGDPNGLLFVLQQDKKAVQNWYAPIVGDQTNGYAGDPANGRRVRPRPLVLRANAGECIQVETLTNELQPDQMAPLPAAGQPPRLDARLRRFVRPEQRRRRRGRLQRRQHGRRRRDDDLLLAQEGSVPVPRHGHAGRRRPRRWRLRARSLRRSGRRARWFPLVRPDERRRTVIDHAEPAVRIGRRPEWRPLHPVGDRRGRRTRVRESVEISQGVIPVVIGENAEAPHPADPAIEDPAAEAPAPDTVAKVGHATIRIQLRFGGGVQASRVPGQVVRRGSVGEETGLSSWVYGDPSTVKLAGGSGPWLPVQPDYADADPLAVPGGIPAPNVEDCGLLLTENHDGPRHVSCYTANVTNAYQGDPLKIRFGHAGIYETHVFHLHAHTWSAEPDDNGPAGSIPPRPTPSGPAAGHHDRLADLQPLDGVHRRHQLRRRSTCRHRRRHDLPCHLYPHFAASFSGAPARARRRGERHRHDP